METARPGARVRGAESLPHDASPYFPCCPKFGNFLEEVVVGIEEETEARREFIHGHSAADPPLDIFNSVSQSKRELLDCGGARLANMISADGNGIPARNFLCADHNRVHDKTHGRCGREDVFLLSDVLFQDVVLSCT